MSTLTACVASEGIECRNGLICPRGRVCDEAHGQCALPEQVTACEGLADGDPCDDNGVCDEGFCVGIVCGDGYVNGDEQCDDGNTVSGDGCSADCGSSEVCGNGVLDEAFGELCDCGDTVAADGCLSRNSDMAGAECKQNCTLHCGDGQVNTAEDCDPAVRPLGGCLTFGFQRGPLLCGTDCAFEFDSCFEFGLESEGGPGLVGNDIVSMALDDTGELFAISLDALGARDANGAWATETGIGFAGQSVSAAGGFALAVGLVVAFIPPDVIQTSGAIRQWDGSKWVAAFSGISPAGTRWGFDDVYVESPSEAVIVGHDIDPGDGSVTGQIWTYDGSAWVRHTVGSAALFGVAPLGDGRYIAVAGTGPVVIGKDDTWTTRPVPNAPLLRDVWAASPTEVFAVGDSGSIVFFDGSSFTPMPSPVSVDLLGVVGRSATDVYAVGSSGTILHYDGRGWFPIVTNLAEDFEAVAIDSVALYIGGANFTTFRLPTESWGAFDGRLFSLNRRFIGGSGDSVYIADGPTLLEYDGSAFTSVATTPQTILEMFVQAKDSVFYARSLPNHRVDHWVGGTTISIVGSYPNAVGGLWADSPQHFFVGAGSSIFENTSGTETEQVLPLGGETITAIAGYSDGTIYVGTSGGDIYEGNSSGFVLAASAGSPIEVVWVAPDGTVFVGGEAGTMYHRDANGWLPALVESDQAIVAIHGSSSSDVFATTVGSLHHYDGARWSPVENDGAALVGVYTTPQDAFFVATDSNQLRRLIRPNGW